MRLGPYAAAAGTTLTLLSVERVPIDQRFERPSVMGVINVTPDSFSDGGVHLRTDAAVAAAWAMLDDGAAIVDVGGESTRPGSEGVPVDEELAGSSRCSSGSRARRSRSTRRRRRSRGERSSWAPSSSTT